MCCPAVLSLTSMLMKNNLLSICYKTWTWSHFGLDFFLLQSFLVDNGEGEHCGSSKQDSHGQEHHQWRVFCEVGGRWLWSWEELKYQTDYGIVVFDNVIVSMGVASLKAAWRVTQHAVSVHTEG